MDIKYKYPTTPEPAAPYNYLLGFLQNHASPAARGELEA